MVDQNGENALARAYPVSDARDHRPGSATNGQGLPPGGRRRLNNQDNGLCNGIPDETHEHVLHEEREPSSDV